MECREKSGTGKMSITIDMPPAMEREAREYTMLEGKSLQEMFLDYLRKEFERSRTAALSKRQPGGLRGEFRMSPDFEAESDEVTAIFENSSL